MMQRQRERKLSTSSVSTQGSCDAQLKNAAKWLLKGQFVHQQQNTQVFIYDDSIAFSNLNGLTIMTLKNSMKFQVVMDGKDPIGFKLIEDQNHWFSTQCWSDFGRWMDIFTKKLIRVGFHQLFAIKKMIGEGAFGKVYIANEISTGSQVAVKVISKSNTDNFTQFLDHQISTLRKINHKNIIDFKGVYEAEHAYYLVFEYFQGVNLENYLFQNKLSLQQRKSVLRDILEAVSYLHSARIVHRDIKPANILINPDTKKIKLIDFGLSVNFGEVKNYNWCGTLGYVAPESLNENNQQYDDSSIQKIDNYSIGTVFYQLIFNQRLHNGFNSQETKNFNIRQQLNTQSLKCVISEDQLDLLKSLLERTSKTRTTLRQALEHWYFAKNIVPFQQWKSNKTKSNKKSGLKRFFKSLY